MKNEYHIMCQLEMSSTVIQSYNEIDYSSVYSAKDIEHINATWEIRQQEALLKNINLFDSEIFSLVNINKRKDTVDFIFGCTTYKDYVGTRTPTTDISRSDPVGTVVIPITSDNYIPIGKRSEDAEVNPGKYFTFGGYFDFSLDWDEQTNLPNIYKCIKREIKEELGYIATNDELRLLGVVYDNINCHPEFCFSVHPDLDRAGFGAMNWREELATLEFIHFDMIESFVKSNERLITPTLIGGFELLLELG